MREMVLVRSLRGAPFSHPIDPELNPDRVIYQIEVNGGCTYLGTLTHAGAASPALICPSLRKEVRACEIECMNAAELTRASLDTSISDEAAHIYIQADWMFGC